MKFTLYLAEMWPPAQVQLLFTIFPAIFEKLFKQSLGLS